MTKLISLLMSLGIIVGISATQLGDLSSLSSGAEQQAALTSIQSVDDAAQIYYMSNGNWATSLSQVTFTGASDSTSISGTTVTWTDGSSCYDDDLTTASAVVAVTPCPNWTSTLIATTLAVTTSGATGFTATLTAADESASMTGSVAFSDSTTGVVLCTATVSDGVASCNLDPSDLAPGASTFVAVYLGDSSYAASSDTGSYTVSS